MVKVKKVTGEKKSNKLKKQNGALKSEAVVEVDNSSVKMQAKKRKLATSDQESTGKKIKTKVKNEKLKAPTVEEINELKDTRNLFHSNLFRLQVKEMLTEIKIKDKYQTFANKWLENFKQFAKDLVSMPEKQNCDEMLWLQRSILKFPFSSTELGIEKQKKFYFQFIKPNVEPYFIGSFATRSWLGSKLVADVCVQMPAECFQRENCLNFVYEQKRAYYLTYLVNQMLKSKYFGNLNVNHLKYNYYSNNPHKSVLEITPTYLDEKLASKVIIRVFVAGAETSFKLSRFVPWTNNVQSKIFGEIESEASVGLATPGYNANVLFDLTMQRNQQLLNEIFTERLNFQDGLILLKVWIQQRQLNTGFSGFSTHILAMFIVYLFKHSKLHANMSSYQVARTVWNQLAHSNWDEDNKGISICPPENKTVNQPSLEQFHTYYDVVFVDATGFYNICANLSLEMYKHVRSEAKLAVDMLNDMRLNSFHFIFMTKSPIYTQFDHILKINNDDTVQQILEMHAPPQLKLNYTGNSYVQLLKVITSLLRKGLGKRVKSFLPLEQLTQGWEVDEKPQPTPKHLHLGIILDPDHAFEVLDKGPETIAEEAEEFRKFWGDEAKLRRFQDGTITESVVWASTSDTQLKKRLIVQTIVKYLLQYHFQLEEKDFGYIAGELDIVYKLTSAFKTDKVNERYRVEQDTDAEALSLRVIRVFNDLARKLQGLNELPLEIVYIAGTSPVFRYCESVPILPQARYIGDKLFAQHMQCGVIQLSSSGKWPSELTALRAAKVAFYIEIARLLQEKHKLRTEVTYDGILILKEGYCFKIEIAHPKEIALLKKEINERGITQYTDSESSVALEKRHYILPKVTGALHALYQSHPTFGATVMIAKRWLHSQLIDDGLWPEECTELLIASQFTRTNSPQVITSAQMGFIRYLHLLAHTDWNAELFLLNFNNALDENKISEIEYQFHATREKFPSLCIITAYDQKHYGYLWSTSTKPNANVLARVTILARQALAIIESSLLSIDEIFIKPSKLFTASNQGYNLIIQLKPDMVPNTMATDFGSPFTAMGKPNWRLPLADTNFVKAAVQKLREGYSDFAAFFYNPNGGKEIGIVWKPDSVFEEREFKINEVNGCALSDTLANKIQCKKEILVEDFKFILKDFSIRIDSAQEVFKASRITTVVEKERYFKKEVPESK
ncbi:nucleolar protein 6 isoform X2 [Teleopsis dalmanni]|uniref:nucleolar protein 6 isoform X2 n=1 Tax=Teleopsis dalmanni TaxID=139649 RepID=UPI0018CFCE11|nr:nucleolar protein 6 isoform X2 [Teleopsis dalmanni]